MSTKLTLSVFISLLLLLLVVFNAGAAGPNFTYHTIQANFSDCTGVSAADLDGNGKVDVMASAPGTVGIKWWANNGTGTFGAASQLSYGFTGGTTMFADDFDEDGDQDVVAYSSLFNKLAWFENKGSNTWTQRYMSVYNPTAIAPLTFDVENSGKRYVLVANGMHKDVQYIQPDTSTDGYDLGGAMDDAYTDVEQVSALYVEDMDRDGKADALVASNASSYPEWYSQSQIGRDIGTLVFPRPSWISGYDVDQDGDADVLGASDTLGLFWWENKNGQGTYFERHTITRYDIYLASSLHVLDLDVDGDLDIIGSTKTELVWWENLGNPTEASGWLRHKIGPGLGYSLSPADVNHDGRMDIVSCHHRINASTSEVGWWENNLPVAPVSHRQFWRSWMNGTPLDGAWGVDLADFNRDGWLDVAVAGEGDGVIDGETRVLQNPAVDDELVWTQTYTYTLDDSRGVSAYSRWRGQPHYLVATHSPTGKINDFNPWWPGATATTPLTGLYYTYMGLAADVSNDGKFDILSISDGRPDHFNTTTGKQERLGAFYECDGGRTVDVGDINGDGSIDVAAACPDETKLHWWENSSSGFGVPKTVPVQFPGAVDVKVADLDGDGQQEMVAAGGGKSIAWFKPNAEIGFGDKMGWVTDSFTGTEHIAIADVDRDGRLDVVATSPSRDELYWFRNEIPRTATCYSGCFTPYKLDEAQGGFREVAVGDVNNDGAPDIVAAVGNSILEYRQVVTADISVEKRLDPFLSTSIVDAGQGIHYDIDITHNGPTGLPADVLVVDTWDPPHAVAAASGKGCTASPSEGIMRCVVNNLDAGKITTLDVVITPSLLYDGYITNSVVITSLGLLRNENFSDTSDQAVPVKVNKNPNMYDLLVKPGTFPMDSVAGGNAFFYSVAISNLGPGTSGSATMVNQWSPMSAVTGFQIVGFSGASLSAMDNSCTGEVDDGAVSCEVSGLAAGETITVTIGVTTSKTFTDVMANTITITGDENEGISQNNETWPIRVAVTPNYPVYLPIVMKND